MNSQGWALYLDIKMNVNATRPSTSRAAVWQHLCPQIIVKLLLECNAPKELCIQRAFRKRKLEICWIGLPLLMRMVPNPLPIPPGILNIPVTCYS